MINADIFDLAVAIREAGLAQGDAAIAADALMTRLRFPTMQMQCEAEIERRAAGAALDAYQASLEGPGDGQDVRLVCDVLIDTKVSLAVHVD